MDFFANPYLKEKIWYDPLPRNIAELNVRIVACIKGIPENSLLMPVMVEWTTGWTNAWRKMEMFSIMDSLLFNPNLHKKFTQ